MSAESEAYEVLGIGSTESKDEVRRAFRSSVRALHPDHGGGADGETIAALVGARDLLTGAEREGSSGTWTRRWPSAPPAMGARAGDRRIHLLFAGALVLLSVVVVVFTVVAFAESG